MNYRERLHPGIGTIVPCLLIIPAGYLVFAPIAWQLGLAVGTVLLTLVISAMWFWFSPVIIVNKGQLFAGRAWVQLKFLGTAEVVPESEFREQLGPSLDSRAYLVIRGWLRTSVRVPINDPSDPTPYWLISSRNPEQLAAALNQR